MHYITVVVLWLLPVWGHQSRPSAPHTVFDLAQVLFPDALPFLPRLRTGTEY